MRKRGISPFPGPLTSRRCGVPTARPCSSLLLRRVGRIAPLVHPVAMETLRVGTTGGPHFGPQHYLSKCESTSVDVPWTWAIYSYATSRLQKQLSTIRPLMSLPCGGHPEVLSNVRNHDIPEYSEDDDRKRRPEQHVDPVDASPPGHGRSWYWLRERPQEIGRY